MGSKGFPVCTYSLSGVVASLNLHVNIYPFILRKNHYGYYIHMLKYRDNNFLSILTCIVFSGVNITVFGSCKVFDGRIILHIFLQN